MEKEVKYFSVLTKDEVLGCAWFFILWDRKRWVFILVTALVAGGVVGDWIRHVWLVGVSWILLCLAILFITNYFNIIRKWLAVDGLFEQREYSLDEETIVVKSRGSNRVVPLSTLRKVVELKDFFVLYGQEPVFFITKNAASASQLELIRTLLGKYAKLSSDRFTRWIGHVIFRI